MEIYATNLLVSSNIKQFHLSVPSGNLWLRSEPPKNLSDAETFTSHEPWTQSRQVTASGGSLVSVLTGPWREIIKAFSVSHVPKKCREGSAVYFFILFIIDYVSNFKMKYYKNHVSYICTGYRMVIIKFQSYLKNDFQNYIYKRHIHVTGYISHMAVFWKPLPIM